MITSPSDRVETAMLDLAAACGIDVLLSRADVFQLSDQAANDIIDEVQQIVRLQWRERMVSRDVGAEDIAKIAGCFDPASFEAQSPPAGTGIPW